MSGNEVRAVVGIHVVVVGDEVISRDMIQGRQPVALSVRVARSDLVRAVRKQRVDAHCSRGDDLITCGRNLAREGAFQSDLCSEKDNRTVSGSLTTLIGIHLLELVNVYEKRREEVAAGYIRPGGAQGS